MLNYAWLYRMISFVGRFGGGKTSLAIAVAQWLCGKNYARYVASNIPLNFGTHIKTVDVDELRRIDYSLEKPAPVHRDTAILMDESWMYLGKGASRKDVSDWLAFMRKGNNFLLMPSVLPLVSDVTTLKVERYFNGMVLGMPAWLYRWTLGNPKQGGDKGHYIWWNPQRVFDLYDSSGIPGEDFLIYDTWEDEE